MVGSVLAEKMGALYKKYDGKDLDVAALYAESLMVLKSWALWVRDEKSGEIVPADSNTLLLKEVLSKVRHSAGMTVSLCVLHLSNGSGVRPDSSAARASAAPAIVVQKANTLPTYLVRLTSSVG